MIPRVRDRKPSDRPSDPAGGAATSSGTLSDALDRSIERTAAAAEAGDPAEIRAALAELQRLFAKYQGTMNHRHGDGRGRSSASSVVYLARCYGYVAVAWAARLALGGPISVDETRRNEEILEGIMELIEDAENHAPRGERP